MVLFIIQDLVSRAGLSVSDNGLNVLHLAESGLHEHLVWIELRLILSKERPDKIGLGSSFGDMRMCS